MGSGCHPPCFVKSAQVFAGQQVAGRDEIKSVEAIDSVGDAGARECGLGLFRAGHEGV
jgi:hypothetical protein